MRPGFGFPRRGHSARVRKARPIPRAAIQAAFAAMLEPAWKDLDSPPATPGECSASPPN